MGWSTDSSPAVEGHEFGVGFDFYDVTDALQPQAAMDAAVFLNSALYCYPLLHDTQKFLDDAVRAAIHAPTSKDWQETVAYPFGTLNLLLPTLTFDTHS